MNRKTFDSLTKEDILNEARKLEDYFNNLEAEEMDYHTEKLLQLSEVDKNLFILYIAVGYRSNRLAKFLKTDRNKITRYINELKQKLR